MKKIFSDSDVDTMTVLELMDFLKKFPSEMPVVATWESQVIAIDPLKFNVETKYLSPLIEEAVLEIDVEY